MATALPNREASGAQDGCQPCPTDERPLILFDLNGTLVMRNTTKPSQFQTPSDKHVDSPQNNIGLIRPGTVESLQHLKQVCDIGVFSSMTEHNTKAIVQILESTSWEVTGAPLELKPVLHRASCKLLKDREGQPARSDDVPNPSLGDAESWSDDGGEKSRTEWATIKPLGEIFGAGRLARILLVDDDSFKAAHSESANMVIIPTWSHQDAWYPLDAVIPHTMRCLIKLLRNEAQGSSRELLDVRSFSLQLGAEARSAMNQAKALSERALSWPRPEFPMHTFKDPTRPKSSRRKKQKERKERHKRAKERGKERVFIGQGAPVVKQGLAPVAAHVPTVRWSIRTVDAVTGEVVTAAQDFAAHSVQRQPGDDVAADIQSGSDFPVPTSHLSLVSTSPGFPSKGSSQFPFASTSKEAARPTDNTNSNDGVSESAKRACTNAELEAPTNGSNQELDEAGVDSCKQSRKRMRKQRNPAALAFDYSEDGALEALRMRISGITNPRCRALYQAWEGWGDTPKQNFRRDACEQTPLLRRFQYFGHTKSSLDSSELARWDPALQNELSRSTTADIRGEPKSKDSIFVLAGRMLQLCDQVWKNRLVEVTTYGPKVCKVNSEDHGWQCSIKFPDQSMMWSFAGTRHDAERKMLLTAVQALETQLPESVVRSLPEQTIVNACNRLERLCRKLWGLRKAKSVVIYTASSVDSSLGDSRGALLSYCDAKVSRPLPWLSTATVELPNGAVFGAQLPPSLGRQMASLHATLLALWAVETGLVCSQVDVPGYVQADSSQNPASHSRA